MRPARRRAVPTISPRSCRATFGDTAPELQLGHVEQVGDEAVEPLGFVDDGGQQVRLLGVAELAADVAQGAGGAEHRGERRLQVVRDRGQQRGAQALGFGDPLDAIHLLHQPHAFDRQRALVEQGVEQAALVGRQQRSGLVAVDADHADGAAAGMHRQEQPPGAGQRVGAAAGGVVVFPGPARGGEIGVVENVLRRIAGLDRDRVVFGQQQHDPHFQQQRGLIGGSPKHVVERSGAGQLAAERIEGLGDARAFGSGLCLGAASRRHARHDDGHEREKPERHHVVRIGDRQRIDRRQEEKIVRQRGRHARQQRRQQPEPDRDRHDRRQEHQIDIGVADPVADQFGEPERESHGHQRGDIGSRVERIVALGGAHRLLRNRLSRNRIAGDDVHADVAGTADEIVHDRAVHHLEPARAGRLADDDLRDVVGLRVAHHVLGDAAIAGRQRHRLAAKRLGQPKRVGDAIAFFVGELRCAPALDVERRPRSVQAVSEPFGVANQSGAAPILADADQDALARRPRPGDGVRLHLAEQLLVDALGRPAQRQLAQGGEIGGRKEMLERALGLLGDVDLALFQPLNEIVGREIDELDRVGSVEHGVRHGFAHPHMRDLGDDVVEALDVLNIDRGIDVDAAVHQLFDVEIALGMAAAFGVGVRKFVDQHELRPPGDDGVEIHFLEPLALVLDAPARHDLEPGDQRLGLAAAVGFDHPDDDVIAVFLARVRLLQHFVGLADAGRGADEDPKLADAALPRAGPLPEAPPATAVGRLRVR